MTICDECGQPTTEPTEAVAVEGKTIKVGECCFWYFMEN